MKLGAYVSSTNVLMQKQVQFIALQHVTFVLLFDYVIETCTVTLRSKLIMSK
jgi:hypothetical protein